LGYDIIRGAGCQQYSRFIPLKIAARYAQSQRQSVI